MFFAQGYKDPKSIQVGLGFSFGSVWNNFPVFRVKG